MSFRGEKRGMDIEYVQGYSWIFVYLYQWGRSDLGFAQAVTFLSRDLHKPGEKHLPAAKHVLCYLKGTSDLEIRYTGDLARLHARD